MHPMRWLNLHALGAHLGGRARRNIYYIPIFYLGFALLCTISDDEMMKKKGFMFENFVIFRYI